MVGRKKRKERQPNNEWLGSKKRSREHMVYDLLSFLSKVDEDVPYLRIYCGLETNGAIANDVFQWAIENELVEVIPTPDNPKWQRHATV